MILKQNEGNIVSDMQGELVMLNIRKGKYYNLGQLGGRIWQLIAEQLTVDEIVQCLLAEYDIDQQTCEEQVNEFLEQLLAQDLISSE